MFENNAATACAITHNTPSGTSSFKITVSVKPPDETESTIFAKVSGTKTFLSTVAAGFKIKANTESSLYFESASK